MKIKEAQRDMRSAYVGGGSGVLTSGLVWLMAGLLAIYVSPQTSIVAFFFGGMLIHPMGILISKVLGRTGQHKKGNPLAALAIESLLILFVGLFLAYSTYIANHAWFFSIMLMIIGSRYVLFQSIYGMKIYWLLGLILAVVGVATFHFNQPLHIAALLGGGIEIVFAVIIYRLERGQVSDVNN